MQALSNQPLTDEERKQIEVRVLALEVEHHDLDDVIARIVTDPRQDELQLRRLKKRKLLLKDTIARVFPGEVASEQQDVIVVTSSRYC